MSGESTAASRALAQVVHAEQLRTLSRMAYVRLGVAILVVISMNAFTPTEFDTRPSLYGGWAYLTAALINFYFVVMRRSTGTWSAYAIAALDIPLVTLVQWWQAQLTPDSLIVVPSNLALMFALSGLSALSMSSSAIGATWASAQVSIVLVSWPHMAPVIRLMVCVVLAGMVVSSWLMVRRVRQLVVESRQRDLLGKYVLGERLGAGGMAEVFRATYSPEGGFERQVAVKRILPSYADNQEWIAMFRREAELGATLAHPNIVQVLDFGADGTTYFLAMEFIDGIPLGRLMNSLRERNRTLSIDVIMVIATALAEALDYIHTRVDSQGQPLNLIHRDINPPNVMVSRIGEVKLADFGVARTSRTESLTVAGTIRGKLGYTAPEQLEGQPYDSRADLFAFGVTLFELITDKRLFQAPTDYERMRATLAGFVPPPSATRPDCPPALDELVLALCERDVSKRTQSAALVRQQLMQMGNSFDLAKGRLALAAEVADAMRLGGDLAAQVSSKSHPIEPTATSVLTPRADTTR